MNDGAFFVGLLLFIFIAWVYTGGPSHPISFAGPYITPLTGVHSEQIGYGDAESDGAESGDSTFFNPRTTIDSLKRQMRDAADFGTPSQYKGMVRISGGDISATNPKEEYVTLEASYDAPKNLSISGWRLEAVSTGYGATIPQGVELYRSANPLLAPIVLHPGDTAYVTTGEAPNDVSFRENSCMGYLNFNDEYHPEISGSCPSASDEYDRYYTGNKYLDTKCYDLAHDTYGCTTPRESRGLSSPCIRFISTYLNYNGCVLTHQGDSDFKEPTWHIFLGRSEIKGSRTAARTYGELWKGDRGAIRLLDAEGKTVDLYEY